MDLSTAIRKRIINLCTLYLQALLIKNFNKLFSSGETVLKFDNNAYFTRHLYLFIVEYSRQNIF